MAIRNACKALIIRDGSILLVHNTRRDGSTFYDLPGGGQNPYETLEEAVVRECLEETGYAVEVEGLACIHESICDEEEIRREHPDHTHIIFFVLRCRLTDAPQVAPSEPDGNQCAVVWLPLQELANANSANFRASRIQEYILQQETFQAIRHIPAERWPSE